MKRLAERLRAIAMRNDVPPIGDIRNLGGMIAFELVKSRGSSDPDADMTKKVTGKALDNGLVLLSCGVFANTIRILVPLTAANKIVDEGLDIIERSLIQAAAA